MWSGHSCPLRTVGLDKANPQRLKPRWVRILAARLKSCPSREILTRTAEVAPCASHLRVS
jgi:hypothetical protein